MEKSLDETNKLLESTSAQKIEMEHRPSHHVELLESERNGWYLKERTLNEKLRSLENKFVTFRC